MRPKPHWLGFPDRIERATRPTRTARIRALGGHSTSGRRWSALDKRPPTKILYLTAVRSPARGAHSGTRLTDYGTVAMDREEELGLVRRAYAKEIVATAGIPDARVEMAFAEVRREDFLDPGPWLVIGQRGDYVPIPDADPACLYLDHVAILPERHLNNGQPSLHALLLAHAGIREGDHVVHVGAGTGY